MIEEYMKDSEFKEKIKKRIQDRIYINDTGCWVWMKSKHSFGYGKISIRKNGKKYQTTAPRATWIIYKGEIEKGKRICHHCDNPSCCNPEHLFIGTAKENTHDMIRKGRMHHDFCKGENNYASILNEKIVLEMRELRKKGLKVVDIAKLYNVKYFTCLDAISGRNWKHI